MSRSELSNMVALREHALRTLEKLESGEIDTATAGVAGKLYESVISSVKTELAYAHMVAMVPRIDFIEESATYTGPMLDKTKPGFQKIERIEEKTTD